MEIRKKVSLVEYSTYRTGGKADLLCECKSVEDVKFAANYAMENELNYEVIGGGSNVLFSDDGFRGLVIINRANQVAIDGQEVCADSGCLLSQLINKSIQAGLSGLENLSGIPGTVGGAVYGNAGANGVEISDCVVSVDVLRDGEVLSINKSDLGFDYRSSMFKGQDSKDVILRATFRLKREDSSALQIRQKDTLSKRHNPKGLSCGSFFKNPEGDSAGRVIDSLGFKGKKVGGAVVSMEHANFIINTGNATSQDIYNLSQEIKKAAHSRAGVVLEEEVRLIGEF